MAVVWTDALPPQPLPGFPSPPKLIAEYHPMGCTESKLAGQPRTSHSNEEFPKDRYLAHVNGGPAPQKSDVYRHRQAVLDQLDKQVEKKISLSDSHPPLTALFLGTGESGKSTVFKQIRLCHGTSFTNFERRQYAKLIWADTLRSMRSLVDMCYEELVSSAGSEGLVEIVSQWFNGDILTQISSNGLIDSSTPRDLIPADAGGKLSFPLVQFFATVYPPEPFLGEKSTKVEALAIRNAVRLIQSLDLSRQAFLAMEQDSEAHAFLHNHVQGDNPNLSNDSVVQQLENMVNNLPDPHSDLSRAISGNGAFGDHTDYSMRPKVAVDGQGRAPTRLIVACAVHLLWTACPEAIRRMVYANQLGMETNAAYFLDHIHNYLADNFLAADEDILRARIKTTGMTSSEFSVNGHTLVATDVGGQRIERKKWIHNFDDSSCVLFVVSVSEYDQGLEEEEGVNRLDEALEVFEFITNSQWFRAKSFQLFLNKIDILQEKCKYSSFKAHYSDFQGDDENPEDIMEYIEKKFRSRFKWGSRHLYVHRTCATDINAMKFVIQSVSDMVLFENLKWAGML